MRAKRMSTSNIVDFGPSGYFDNDLLAPLLTLKDDPKNSFAVINVGSPCGTRWFSRESVAHRKIPTASLPPKEL